MTKFLAAVGKAASFTARGAAVTFGSTVFSCVAACNIEKGANRMIYKYYPHKFANVEAASGITQEELDFVHFIYGGSIVAADQEMDKSSSSTTGISTTNEDSEVLLRYDSYDDSSVLRSSQYHEPESSTTTRSRINTTEVRAAKQEEEEEKLTVNKFWTEGEEAAAKALSIIPAIIVPRQEILACSMTA